MRGHSERGHACFSISKNRHLPNSEHGFILLTVVVAITLIAAIALALSYQGASKTNIASGELQRDQLRYVAEAGIAHARSNLTPNDTCDSYTDILSTPFGSGSYTANVSPTVGSPVSVTATGTLTSGALYTLRRDDVKIYDANTTQTISLQPGPEGDDAEIWDKNPDNNYGDSGETWVSSASNDTTRSLLRFNMDAIPDGATVLGATLSLLRQSGSGADQPVSAHRIRNPWSEDSVTWNSREFGTNWDTAGGDFENTAVATTPVGPVNQRYEWYVASLVQGWVDGSYPNYGVALIAAIDGMSGERFYTSDESNLDRRPVLTVTYACECGQPCVAGIGAQNVLFVVANDSGLTTEELAHQALIESWGYTVELIDDGASQTDFDTAIADNDVVYTTNDITANNVGTKLVDATIGVVTSEDNLSDEFGMASSVGWESGTVVEINDNTHYITSPFATGTLTVFSGSESLAYVTGTLSPDLGQLASSTSGYGIVTLDAGGSMYGGGTAAGRRVQLPWGGSPSLEPNDLNADGLTILQRALEWGAGVGNVTTLETRVAAGNDDSEQRTGDGYADNSSSDLELAYDIDGSNTNLVGMRFTGVAVPQGATITNAYIQFQVDELKSSATSLSINGQDIDNAAPFTTTDFDISDRATTVASVPWVIPLWNTVGEAGPDQRTPNIAAIIQEIVGRPGWSSGNALVVMVTGTGTRTAEAYEGDPAGAPLLHIEYDGAGGGGTPTAPIAHWKMDETSGTTAVDSEGGHDGTLVNSPAWATGHLDGALDFDGTNDFVDVPHDDNLSLIEAMTFTAWINASSFGASYQTIVAKDAGGAVSNYYFGTWQQELVFGFFAGGSFREIFTSGLDLQAGSWYHLAASFDNATGQILLYVNGAQVRDGTLSFSPSAVTANLTIGRSPDGERWRGLMDDVRIYDQVLSTTDISALASGGGGGGGPGYNEAYAPWSATNNDTWESVDLGPFGVPANAVVEVAVINADTGKQLWGGVRATGSTLDRRLQLHEAESGGVDVMVMTVQADASSQIEHYSDNPADVTFILLGYWGSGIFVESWDYIDPGVSGTWTDRALNTYGVTPGSVAEILAHNGSANSEIQGGVRSNGSSLDRRFDIHEPEAGGRDMVTLLVNADTDADATIELFMEHGGGNFYLMGHWSTPPGVFTEAFVELAGSPASSATWDDKDLTSLGVPANAVVQIVMANGQDAAESLLGVRETGSSIERTLNLQEAEAGGDDLASIHVTTDANSTIQWYDQNTGEDHRFYLLGWWVLP